MSPEKGFRKLRVWQEAHEFVKMIYKATDKFPKEELFSLTSQIRRAALSIPANIVEDYAYRLEKNFCSIYSSPTARWQK